MFHNGLFSRLFKNHLYMGRAGPFGMWPVMLPLRTFQTHVYAVGQSGAGKSKFLQHILFELATKDWGAGLLDPHSDLATDLLAQLASYPKKRSWLSVPANRRRLVYIDPSRSTHLVPMNILMNSAATPYDIANNVVEAFRRVWPDTLSEAPRFAQIMRNAVLVLAMKKLSLLELERLLTDLEFRTRLLAGITDPLVVSFFETQFNRWGKDQVIFAGPVLNKVSAFLFKPEVRLMLGAAENRLDLRKIMDGGQVLIVDLGGFEDEETQRLMGSLLMTSMEQAALSRRNLSPQKRIPFFLTIDEFPLFCARDSTALARILSECRKYALRMALAHQTITQLPTERLQGALENAKLKVVFGTGRQTAEAIVKELFIPDTTAVKHQVKDETAQERTHPLFDPMMEQFERFTQTIQRLRRRRVLVKLPDKERVYHLKTPTVPKSRIGQAQLERIKDALVRQVGVPRAELERQIRERHTIGTQSGQSPSDPLRDVWQKVPKQRA